MATKKKILTLEEKYSLIKDSAGGQSQRKLAAKYQVSIGTVNATLKRKRELSDAYESNINPKTKLYESKCIKRKSCSSNILYFFKEDRTCS